METFGCYIAKFGYPLLGALGGTLGTIILTVLFQEKMENLVAMILPSTLLVGNNRKLEGDWEISYKKYGKSCTFKIKLKQIGKRVWGSSKGEEAYKLYGRLKGDKLSGVWIDTDPMSTFHGPYFVDIATDGSKAIGTVLTEDDDKKVISCDSTWNRLTPSKFGYKRS